MQQRQLTTHERQKAEDLVRLNVPAKSLHQEMRHLTGKNVTLQDIHNIHKTVRKKVTVS